MTALILAGGRGTRLVPWHAPKCLLPIGGVPILYRLIQHLRGGPIDRFVVCTGYRAADVDAALASFGWADVTTCRAAEDTPMGARLLLALGKLEIDGSVLVCYADELADVDILELLATHRHGTGNLMTFTVCPTKIPGGLLQEANLHVGERARLVEGKEALINIGFIVAERSAFGSLQGHMGVSEWVDALLAQDKCRTFLHTGKRATVNALADIRNAEEVWGCAR